MYDSQPALEINNNKIFGVQGFAQILEALKQNVKERVVAFETYPGVSTATIVSALRQGFPKSRIVSTEDLLIPQKEIMNQVESDISTDPTFGRFSHRSFTEFLDPAKLAQVRDQASKFPTFIVGICAADIIPGAKILYWDITRREILLRMSSGDYHTWLNTQSMGESEMVRHAYFFEWPAADERKKDLLTRCAYYVDASDAARPKMLNRADMQAIFLNFQVKCNDDNESLIVV
ncbi:hypothetical protein, partial [Lacticaseibacillus camelliae]|uniref:hypothetical protein n=2 Tax=Lacticaseibacillus camelliae TaxID=381742 RepID=UPI000A8F22FA